MPTYLQIIILVLGAAVCILLFVKNQALSEKVMTYEGDLELATYDLRVANEEIESYQMARQQDDATIINLQKENKQLRRMSGKAKRERDDAMGHLEKTLESNAVNHTVPDRIAGQVGRDGVYYSFSYDPPAIEPSEVDPPPFDFSGYGRVLPDRVVGGPMEPVAEIPTQLNTIFTDESQPVSNIKRKAAKT